jgi:hypothetical protein
MNLLEVTKDWYDYMADYEKLSGRIFDINVFSMHISIFENKDGKMVEYGCFTREQALELFKGLYNFYGNDVVGQVTTTALGHMKYELSEHGISHKVKNDHMPFDMKVCYIMQMVEDFIIEGA